MSELGEVLAEFDDWFRAERPDVHRHFRPGLSHHELAVFEARLAPYRLPADLVTLYTWHDGCPEAPYGSWLHLLPDTSFSSLGEAIHHYEGHISLARDDEMYEWNPLWFPAFGSQHHDFVELQAEPGRPAGVVWSHHTHGGEVSTSYPSVASLFETTLGLWRTGLLPSGEWPEIRAFIVERNPETRRPDGPLYREISRVPTLYEWPDEWLIADGIAIPTPADDAEVIMIAELLADPWSRRPVRGAFRFTAGGPGVGFGTLTDETGSVQVEADRESTENFRVLWPSPRVEMILTPITEGKTVDEALAGAEGGDPLEESVTRRILEATAASFHAERVVPLAAPTPPGSDG